MSISLKQFIDLVNTVDKSSFSLMDIEIWTYLSQIRSAVANDPVLKTASNLMNFDPWRYPGFYQKCYLRYQSRGLTIEQKSVLDLIFECFLQNTIEKHITLYQEDHSEPDFLWCNINIDPLLIKEKKIHDHLVKIKKTKTFQKKTLEYILTIALSHYQKKTAGSAASHYLLFLKKASENIVFQEILSSNWLEKNKAIVELTLSFFCDKEFFIDKKLKNSESESDCVSDYVCTLLCPPSFDTKASSPLVLAEWNEMQQFFDQWHYHSTDRAAEPTCDVENSCLLPVSDSTIFVSQEHVFAFRADMADVLKAITSHYCSDELHLAHRLYGIASPAPLTPSEMLRIQAQIDSYCKKIHELEKKLIRNQIHSYKKVFFSIYQFDPLRTFSQQDLENFIEIPMNCCGSDDFQHYLIEAKLHKTPKELENLLEHALTYQYDLFFPKSFLFLIEKLFELNQRSSYVTTLKESFFSKLMHSLRQSIPYGLENFSSRYFLYRCQAIWLALAENQTLELARALFEQNLIDTFLNYFKDYLYLIEKTTTWANQYVNFSINSENQKHQDLIERLVLQSDYEHLEEILFKFKKHFEDRTVFENIRKLFESEKDISKPLKIFLNHFPQVLNLVDSDSHTLLYYALLAEHDTAFNILYTFHAHHQKAWLNSLDERQRLKNDLNPAKIPMWHKLLHERPSNHAIDFSIPFEDGKNLYQHYVDTKQYFAIETMVEWIQDGFGGYSNQIDHPIFYAIQQGDSHAVKVISPLYSSTLITSEKGLTPFEYCILIGKTELLDSINESVCEFESCPHHVKKNMIHLARSTVNTASLDWMLEKIAKKQKDPFSLIESWVNLYKSFGLLYACFFFIRFVLITFASQKKEAKKAFFHQSLHSGERPRLSSTSRSETISPLSPPVLFRRVSSSSFPVPPEHSDESELAFIFRSAQNSIDETHREENSSEHAAISDRSASRSARRDPDR